MTRELAASRQKANDAKSDYLNQIAAMSEEIEETRRELKLQESFVYQLAETNKGPESENATQIAADTKDRGRALLTLLGPVNKWASTTRSGSALSGYCGGIQF